jgi:hypothetical protein
VACELAIPTSILVSAEWAALLRLLEGDILCLHQVRKVIAKLREQSVIRAWEISPGLGGI